MTDTPARVLCILRFPENIRDQYQSGIVEAFPDITVTMVATPEDAFPHLAETDVLVTFGPMLGEHASNIFQQATALKWVQAMGTGVDGIVDVQTLSDDVIVTNVHGIHGAPVSEAAISLMLAMSRDLPLYSRQQQKGLWHRPRAPALLEGKTAGIFGIGSIAESLAPRLKALGMKVIGISSAIRDIEGFDSVIHRDHFLDLAGDLDHLILLTPLTDATRNIIGREALAAMKPSAFLINVARGGIVDESALVEALKEGQIAGAALDVFAIEPLPSEHPLWCMDNVLITPHTGGFNDAYPRLALPTLIENMKRFLAGERKDLMNLTPR